MVHAGWSVVVIPVAWLAFAEGAMSRGYWHDAMLGDLFDRKLWRPVNGLEYEHVEMAAGEAQFVERWNVLDGIPGAVVIVSGADNADHVADLNRFLEPLPWCLVIVGGDEVHLFPRDEIEHPNCEVWAQCTRPDDTQRALGFGYAPGTREALHNWRVVAPARDTAWSFVGQITNARRDAMLQAAADEHLPPGTLVGTDRFAAHLDGQGLAHDDYMGLLTRSRVVLCPSGPNTVDSFRLFEALEAGCTPLADSKTPTFDDPGYWTRAFGEPPPFPVLGEWESLGAWLAELLPDATATANRISAWYQQFKRNLAYDLDAHVRALMGSRGVADVGPGQAAEDPGLGGVWRPRPAELADQITVIVTTSPAPLHPSTAHIEETIASVREQLPGSEIILVADGVRPEQEDRRADYDEYLSRLLWLCNLEWSNVLPILQPEWGHQANAMRRGLAEVRTPLVLFVEHDTPLVGEIDWEGCASAIRSGSVDVIRFHPEASVLDVHQYLMLDEEPSPDGPVPLLRTVQWSQRPHLAPTLWYQDVLDRYFAPESRTMIEDVLYGIVENAWNAYGMAGWEQWRVALYAPPLPMKRSTHLDSRGDDPKFDCQFAYPGPTPAGAPRP